MDYYNILGVAKTASQEEIKKAYRKLAMEHHPDKGGDVSKFQEITTAYETLSNVDKRHQYDNPTASQTHFPGGVDININGFNFDDLFNRVFNQRNPFQQQKIKPIYRTRVTISLMDAYNGASHTMQLSTPDGVKVINIQVPAGISNGDHIRYDSVIPGTSLIIEFIILSDLRFDRQGSDLYTSLPISVLDLIVGTTAEVKTISGKTLEVLIKPSTQPTQQIRISGHGMPKINGGYGDQILLLKPFIPDNVSQDIIDCIRNANNNP